MTDQMQGRVLSPEHPCQTPNLDRLAARGVRFTRAYTPNAVCSPARASLMTGLLPHNHGVLQVTHTTDDDQARLRTDRPHWAQRVQQAGYRTGYFGKWHVERSNGLGPFGWDVNGASSSPLMKRHREAIRGPNPGVERLEVVRHLLDIPGYPPAWLYGVTDQPPEEREMGVVVSAAMEFLEESVGQEQPWCCFVSTPEPHDPFVTSEAFYRLYNIEGIEAPLNWADNLAGRPGLYRKAARPFAELSDQERREAAACYWGRISEIDAQFGRILNWLEQRGELDNTVIVMTGDHGEMLGAHGLYCKNFGAFEEIYNIPLIVAGPGVANGEVTSARVGLHDLGATMPALAGLAPMVTKDADAFVDTLRAPAEHEQDRTVGFAEYFGSRYLLTQRVVWDGDWKYVHNGFDEDELYDLARDPYEMRNLIDDPSAHERLRHMVALMWRIVRETGDHSLLNTRYPAMRLAPYGPQIADF
jgi:arylsulfatase A-like enzyme